MVKLFSGLMNDLVGHFNQTNETLFFTAPLPAMHACCAALALILTHRSTINRLPTTAFPHAC